jgi:hypothetical protein
VTLICNLHKSLSRPTFKFYLFERAEAADDEVERRRDGNLPGSCQNGGERDGGIIE